MRWRKLGRLFVPDGHTDWMATHAMVPLAEHRGGDRFRVYFSARDRQGRGHVAWFEVDLNDPTRVLDVARAPLLGPGPLGAFDDSGVTLTQLLDVDGRKHLYYIGWTRGVSVPFYVNIGLAISDDGGLTYRRVSPAPILGRSAIDPFFTTSAFVRREDGRFRMWYTSGVRWEETESGPRHHYHVRHAESHDGVTWRTEGHVCIDFAGPGEYAIARPCVVRDGAVYRMWYCHRGVSYRIGHALSPDGLRWERHDDQAGIDVSATGWDSEMIAYPHVFEHKGERFMLYNGNDYGRSGVGLAALESA